jgi:hypothetical protein
MEVNIGESKRIKERERAVANDFLFIMTSLIVEDGKSGSRLR